MCNWISSHTHTSWCQQSSSSTSSSSSSVYSPTSIDWLADELDRFDTVYQCWVCCSKGFPFSSLYFVCNSWKKKKNTNLKSIDSLLTRQQQELRRLLTSMTSLENPTGLFIISCGDAWFVDMDVVQQQATAHEGRHNSPSRLIPTNTTDQEE